MSGVSGVSSIASSAMRGAFGASSPRGGAAASGAGDFSKLLNSRIGASNATAPTSAAVPASSINSAADLQLLQSLSQGSNLIGKSIVYNKADGDGTAKGVVQSLRVEGGKIQLVVGGASVPLDRVKSLST